LTINERGGVTDTCSALLLAILHFVMMNALDGKPTDSKRYLTQRYVTSLSLLSVAAFKASLCASLAVAFTQHLWKIMRHRALQVSSIESLHGVRYNPLLLAKWRLILATPFLYLIAVIMWVLAIAILFPPSALTISMRPFEVSTPTLVPFFDASYGQDIIPDDNTPYGISSLSSWTLGGEVESFDGGITTDGAHPYMIYQ
jgi:succinate dehydrogenase/fumarate reductase cytochrome b subunit